jgi:glycosyltransferase involved in cell wall biosynthesis
MDQPLVSVNITTYNRASLLERCLEGVLAQTYPNLEINVVDDASTDGTQDRVRAFLARDKRIHYYQHPENMGNARARNTAFESCSGKYVCFLDDDDEWIDPEKVTRQVAVLEGDKLGRLGIVCSGVNVIGSDGTELPVVPRRPANLVRHILIRNALIHNSTVMTKRSILERVGGFDTRLPRGIDSDFFRSCIVSLGFEVHFMPEITVNYRAHGEDRISLAASPQAQKNILISNYIAVAKYFPAFLLHPVPLFFRLGKMARALFRLVFLRLRG